MLAIQATQPGTFEQPRLTAVALYAFFGGKIGEKLLDLPPTKVVMAEWATGRFVENWTKTLTGIQATGLPAAVTRETQPRNKFDRSRFLFGRRGELRLAFFLGCLQNLRTSASLIGRGGCCVGIDRCYDDEGSGGDYGEGEERGAETSRPPAAGA